MKGAYGSFIEILTYEAILKLRVKNNGRNRVRSLTDSRRGVVEGIQRILYRRMYDLAAERA
jgi:hypothetical protein